MSVEKVREYLRGYGLEDRVLELKSSSATVELAAQALGVLPARIAKTMAFRDQAGDGCVLVVTCGDQKIDNRKFKDAFGMKATMLSPEETLVLTGHAVGGVCPFALRPGVPVLLDGSLRRFDTVYPAAGSANSCVRLTVAELETCSHAAGWVDVCRERQTP